MLNQAWKLAQAGDEDGAESLISRIIGMEPEVSRLGVEASRSRLYAGIGVLAATTTSGVGCFMFLRRKLWVYWARLRRGWRVIWVGGSSNLNGLEKEVKNYIKPSNVTRVENLVFQPGLLYSSHEVARVLYRLARNGVIRLADPNPPKSLAGYLVSGHNLGFAVAVLLVAASLLSVYFSGLTPVLAASRIVFGSLFVLFLPGYSLIEALYPREDELSPLERLALSIGLSLALVPLVGLVLNYTPWGIRLNPIMAALSTLTLALLLVASYRKFGVLRLKVAAEGG
jgi:hypothetical protein